MSIRVSSLYQTYEARATGKNNTTVKTGKARDTKDSVAISSEGKDYQAVRKALESVPDVREDKVNHYTRLIEGNQYNVRPDALAAKLLSGY
jgi:negative regulator of flagellin synthesis FlgM